MVDLFTEVMKMNYRLALSNILKNFNRLLSVSYRCLVDMKIRFKGSTT